MCHTENTQHMNNPIVNKTYSFVRNLYREYLPKGYWEFQLDLGMEMKNHLITLGLLRQLPDEELEVLALSAILHNTGCIEGQYEEKKVSLTIAEAFLRENDYPEDYLLQVCSCIEATQIGFNPRNRLEKMMKTVSHGAAQRHLLYELPEVGDLWP